MIELALASSRPATNCHQQNSSPSNLLPTLISHLHSTTKLCSFDKRYFQFQHFFWSSLGTGMCPLPSCVEEKECLVTKNSENVAPKFKPNHLSLCDPVSFVASFWQRLRHTRRTFVSTWPKPNIAPGAFYDIYVNSFAIAIR